MSNTSMHVPQGRNCLPQTQRHGELEERQSVPGGVYLEALRLRDDQQVCMLRISIHCILKANMHAFPCVNVYVYMYMYMYMYVYMYM